VTVLVMNGDLPLEALRLRQQLLPVQSEVPLGGATVAVPSGRAVWRMCDAIERAPAADNGTLFVESVTLLNEDNATVPVVRIAVFHEGPHFGAEGLYHGTQGGNEGISYWLTGDRSGTGSVPCQAVQSHLPSVTLLTCVPDANTTGSYGIPPAYPNATRWELTLRWNYSGGGATFDARIRMCAAAVPAMYTRTNPARRVPRLGICVSSLSNTHRTLAPKLVVDFIEYYRLLGVHHIAIHMRPDVATGVGAALAAAYAADAPHFVFEAIPSGYVTANPANLDRWAYYDQAATLNSCLGHMRGQVEWLGLFDIDEWLVAGNGTTAEPLVDTLTRWGCSGTLAASGAPRVHATACTDTPAASAQAARLSCLHMYREDVAAQRVPGGAYPGGATALQYFAHAVDGKTNIGLSKLWCDPTAIAATWVHHAIAEPGAASVQVPATAVLFRHFTSYFSKRAESGTLPRASDTAFAQRLAAASAVRLAHPAFALTTGS